MFMIAALVIGQAKPTAKPSQVLGATEVMRRITAASGDKQAFVEAISSRSEMLAYAKASDRMTPDVAAEKWLQLVADIHKTWAKGPVKDGPRTEDAVAILPPPAAWLSIAKRVSAIPVAKRTERDWVLKLLFDELNDQRASERADLEALLVKAAEDTASNSAWSVSQLAVQIAARSGDRAWLADAVLKNLQITGQPYVYGKGSDFVTIVGKERARSALTKLLLKSDYRFSSGDLVDGPPTRDLLVELAIELLPKLNAAPWGLACRVPTARLYPILAKRWPNPKEDPNEMMMDSDRYMAKVVYAVSLDLAGKHDFAVAQCEHWDWPKDGNVSMFWMDPALDKPQYKQAFFSLEAAIAAKHPEKVAWRDLARIAKEIGKTGELAAIIESAKATQALPDDDRNQMESIRVDALLAVDRVDDAAALLIKQAGERNDEDADMRLAVLGQVTNHPAWVEVGIAAAKKAEQKNGGNAYAFYMGREQTFPDLLISFGREAEAESFLAQKIQDFVGKTQGRQSPNVYLMKLVELYYHANRPEDVLELLQHAPGWGGKDLADVYFVNDNYTDKIPFGFYAAWALAKVGRKDEAYRVLQPTLHFARAYDPGYALLLELKGEGAIPILDSLSVRDRFESRPLIWKAEALRRAGKLAEAEKVARSAISLDPSDGESPAGDRLRAYAVLADVRAEQGAAEEASQLRSAVRAIRMAEGADTLIQTGLIERGAKEYSAALSVFDDAYCIQSRLAVQLESEGKSQEAAEHFRKAYELMPTSFGRVESHCFGCEGAFKGEEAQNIALETLSQLARKSPDNPKIHYLLGYMYEAEERIKDALPEFKRATDLDPDYLNAWVHLADAANGIDSTLVGRASLALGRLDPRGLHRESESAVAQPAKYWQVIHDALPPTYVMPRDLMPLHAATDIPAKRTFDSGPKEADWPRVGQHYSSPNVPWRIPITASLCVSEIEVVTSIAELLSYDEQIQR